MLYGETRVNETTRNRVETNKNNFVIKHLSSHQSEANKFPPNVHDIRCIKSDKP